MLQLLFHIIIISVICMTWGLPAWLLAKKSTLEYWCHNRLSALIFLFFAGLLTLSVIATWASLLIPLKFSYLLYATAGLIVVTGIFFRNSLHSSLQSLQNGKKLLPAQWILLLTCFIMILVLGTLTIVNGDTQLYHLQIVRWTNEHGAVPGIANVYPRLGLGSAWFNLISLFHIPGFGNQNFTFLNAALTLWFFLWLTERWLYYYNKRESITGKALSLFYFLLIAYFLFDWQLIRDTANSTSYDFIVTALNLFCISFLIDRLLDNQEKPFSFIFIFLGLSMASFKLSGIFILVLSFFYLLSYRKIKHWLLALVAGIVILLPILLKNYIVSGYPVYPLTYSIGSPDWQVPAGMTGEIHQYILKSNKFYNYQQSFANAFEDTHGIHAFNWIPYWVKGILIQHKILLTMAALSLVFLFYAPPAITQPKKLRVLIIGLWLMAIGWFFTAPDPRFAFGFLLVLAFLPVSLLAARFFPPKIYSPGFYLLSLGVLVYTYYKSAPIRQDTGFLIHTKNVERPPYKTTTRNGIHFIEPERINNNWDKRCYFCPLPCLQEENPFVEPRGQDISDGFRMSQTPDSSFTRTYNY